MAPKKAVKKPAQKAATTITTTRTKIAAPVTETVVSQKQSLQMLQIMIHASLSVVFYTRQFFPDRAYEERKYHQSQNVLSYDDFVVGTESKDPEETSPPFATLKILRRNEVGRVNRFLDWLEYGAFQSLKEGNLKSIEVYVHPNEDRCNILETYTITIRYRPDVTGEGRAGSGLEITNPDQSKTTISATTMSMVRHFRDLAILCTGMPRLTEHDNESGQDTQKRPLLSMALFYENGKNENEHPPGFEGRAAGPNYFAEVEDWETRADVIPDMQIGPQCAALQITYLQHKSVLFQTGFIDQRPNRVLPSNIQFSNIIDSLEDIPMTRQWHATNRRHTDEANMESTQQLAKCSGADEAVNAQTPSTVISTGEQVNSDQSGSELPEQITSELGDVTNTQSSNVRTMQKSTRRMMQRERMTQGDTQAHSLGSDGLAFTSENIDVTQVQDSDPVSCQCGSYDADDDMIQCQTCKTLQHSHCYGYQNANDDRRPAGYKCYRCLEANEGDISNSLRQVVLKRRGMHLAEKHTLANQADFVERLRPGMRPEISTTVAREVYHELRDKGYIVGSGGSDKKSPFVAIRRGTKYESMLKDLFEPFEEIGHHYKTAAPSRAANKARGQKVLGSSSNMMLPPATPASRFNPEPSTGSRTDLNQRAYAPPEQTPTRPPSFRKASAKRARDEDTAGNMVTKRCALSGQQLGQNSQSEFVLDTAMLSSPAVNLTPDGSRI